MYNFLLVLALTPLTQMASLQPGQDSLLPKSADMFAGRMDTWIPRNSSTAVIDESMAKVHTAIHVSCTVYGNLDCGLTGILLRTVIAARWAAEADHVLPVLEGRWLLSATPLRCGSALERE